MKNIFIILLLVGCVIRSSAQATLQVTAGANVKSANNAFIVLDKMYVVNNGSFVQAPGNCTTIFTGTTDVNISGSSTATFDKLNIEKTSGSKVTLQQNLNVAGQVKFISGFIDLNNSVLNLGTTGSLSGETATSRTFTGGNGYVQVINVLNAPVVAANPGNLGAIISSAKNLGSVTIKRGHKAQLNVSGTTPGIRRYYDILPAIDKGLKATLRFQYFDEELNDLNESTLQLWRQDKKSWTNIGYSSRSASLNYVEQTGISALSRWTLSGVLNSASVTTVFRSATKENPEIKNQLSVWPNPVSELVNITIHSIASSLVNLRLYNAAGSLILMRQGKVSAGKNMMTIDISKLPAGTYNLVTEFGGFRQVKQLIKQQD